MGGEGRGSAERVGRNRSTTENGIGRGGTSANPVDPSRSRDTAQKQNLDDTHNQITATTTQLIGKSFRRRRKSPTPHTLPIPI